MYLLIMICTYLFCFIRFILKGWLTLENIFLIYSISNFANKWNIIKKQKIIRVKGEG